MKYIIDYDNSEIEFLNINEMIDFIFENEIKNYTCYTKLAYIKSKFNIKKYKDGYDYWFGLVRAIRKAEKNKEIEKLKNLKVEFKEISGYEW